MKTYHVTLYYLATGMDGIPQADDFGLVEAESAEEAKEKIVDTLIGNESERIWYRSVLTAREIESNA